MCQDHGTYEGYKYIVVFSEGKRNIILASQFFLQMQGLGVSQEELNAKLPSLQDIGDRDPEKVLAEFLNGLPKSG